MFSHVPMTEKVVFVTIDDGIRRTPRSYRWWRTSEIPLTISLADVLIRDDYAYFEKLYETGHVSIQNHTVTHPLDMPGLPASRQLYEISGQQEKLRKEYGVTRASSARQAATTTRRRSPSPARPGSRA